jgi:hypothetical protein
MVGMVTNSIPTCTAGEVGIVGFSFTPRRKNMVEREREREREREEGKLLLSAISFL